MITITLEDGQVIVCERLLAVAYRGGLVQYICDGKVDLIDILHAEDVMRHFRMDCVRQHLEKRAEKEKPKIAIVQNMPKGPKF